MKVLVIGSGGREHAITWKIRQSKRVSELFVAPGNPGTASIAKNIAIAVDDIPGIVSFAKSEAIDLTIVGPELPLSLGLVDALRESGLRVFGPTGMAARLESSKAFAKEVMNAAGVPTAEAQVFRDKVSASKFVSERGAPLVLKADGLAAGKGVFVCKSDQEIEEALKVLFDSLASNEVLVEDFLEGVEASFIVATNGRVIVPMASSHDYKRIGENDVGLNTGGMGSVCPTPRITEAQEQWVLSNVMRPMVEEMERRKSPFQGFLYAGLMIAPDGNIKVLEFNARMGDPECQSVLRRMSSDLFELLFDLADPNLEELRSSVEWISEPCICVVLASEGYPQTSTRGDVIYGIEQAEMIPSTVVFHAGTARNDKGELVT
ncbi:MAG: phosphoribosylamine--glycine ligase, partial [Bdellovibrionales bacterium]|nr:phosphoribosylamine--glycine ligase [Bdellovibrionales bacterium]